MKFSRRDFLRVSAVSFCSLIISSGITACSNDTNLTKVYFNHGVASGDPLTDRVIIWTRLTPQNDLDILNLSYEVSKTKDFKNLVHSGNAVSKKENDYTVKIDLLNLEEGTKYFYRFKSNGKYSQIGQTKTLSSNTNLVKFAVFSCSNYPNGYFNAYEEASKLDDLDVVLHLGDYIYEYGMFEDDGKTPAYATKNAKRIGRELPKDNEKELINLDDYRKRYALYRTDTGLINLHKKVPFITVWDDHEVSNDAYKDGAENHNLPQDGDFKERKLSALKAYFEWLPIRPYEKDNSEIIYRTFKFGSLVSLHMLDTRIIGRDKQLDYGTYFDSKGNFNQNKFLQDVTNSNRKMMGNEQVTWLKDKLISSSSKWEVLGQQVFMGRMTLPAELLKSIAKLNIIKDEEQKKIVILEMNKMLKELVEIKIRMLSGDKTLSKEEQARVNTVLPYNLDAWDGYAYEREVLFTLFKNLNKNLVVLSGDTHNSWANNLTDIKGVNIGVEFAVTSVSSPGMEDYANLTSKEIAMQFEQAMILLVDNLKYANLNQRGFMLVTFTEDEVSSTWHYIDNINSKQYSLDKSREKTLKSKIGKENRKVI